MQLTIGFDRVKLGTKNPVISYLAAGAWVSLTNSVATGANVAANALHFTQFGVVGSDAAACVALTVRADCQACCEATFATGSSEADPAGTAIKFCGCGVGAPCDAECTDNVCMPATAPSQACQACLTTQGSASPQAQCITDGLAACQASAPCKAFMDCKLNCP